MSKDHHGSRDCNSSREPATKQELHEMEKRIMSAIKNWAAQEQADLTAISTTLDSIVAGISNLDALITGFQNSPGTLSASDQAALDSIKAASDALAAKASAISITPPTPAPTVQVMA